MANKFDTRQSVNRDTLPYVGSTANEELDNLLNQIDADLALFGEDRNILLVGGGTVAFTGTSVTFTAALQLHINSKVAGGAPTVVDFGTTTRNVATDGDMIFATINRSTGAGVITDNSATLPAVVDANKDIFLIAKRIGTRIYFRNGMSLSSGESSLLGESGANATLSNLVSPTSVNESLIPSSPFVDLGSSSDPWGEAHAGRFNASANGLDIDGTNFRIRGGATTPSGATVFAVENASNSTNLGIFTDSSFVSDANPTRDILVETGNKAAGTGNSGDIKMQTGTSAGGNRGRIELDARTIGLDAKQSADPSGTFSSSEIYYNTVSNNFRYFDGTVWKDLGTAAAGGINYIENHDAERNTTDGWNRYVDAVQATPVDGTGGTPDSNLQFAITTTDPLRGDFSFTVIKSIQNVQGRGVSTDFTIDDADKAKVLSISFDYEIASGTYADGDLTVYIYDVTNAQVIQPAGFEILNTGIENKHIATFQTASNSTSYRFILHVASTSTAAYSVKMDNFIVGPQTVQFGAPVTGWQSYTSTLTTVSGTITNATPALEYRQVGSNIEIRGKISFSGSSGTWSQLRFSLPPGLSALVSSLGEEPSVGFWNAQDTGVQNYGHGSINGVGSATAFELRTQSDAGTSALRANLTSNTNPFSFDNGDTISISDFSVQIQGWSSSVQMSDSTDTRVVAAKYVGTNGAAYTSGNTLTVNFNTQEIDTHAKYSAGVYTVPVPGHYRISAALITSSAVSWSASDIMQMLLFKNNVQGVTVGRTVAQTTASYTLTCNGSAIVFANAGDTLELKLFANKSFNLDTNNGANHIEIERLSGPSAIAASETVSMTAYKTSGSQTSQSNFQDVASWTSVTDDTHNSFNETTGVYTIPTPGRYEIRGVVAVDVASGNVGCDIFKNNSTVIYEYIDLSSSPNNSYSPFCVAENFNAGDTIRVRKYQDGAASAVYTTRPGANVLSISKVK